jgi:hypothetical protein
MTTIVRTGIGRYRLRRHKQTDYATYGRIAHIDGTDICVTLERPWVDADGDGHRDRGVSRFVPGTYRLTPRLSHLNGGTGHRDYDVWEFVGIPDIDDAQVHIANLPRDLKGCVGVGAAFGDVENPDTGTMDPGITGSRLTFEKWMTETAGYAELEITVLDDFANQAAT